MLIISLALSLAVLLLLIIFLTFAWGGVLAAPWVPARKRDVGRILKLANLKSGEILYDLGSGDGRLIIAAARDFGVRAVGFEVSLLPYLIAWVKIRMLGIKSKVTLRYQNFYRVNLGKADVITTFLSPWAMKRLKPKFEKELPRDCRVVSYAFQIPGWEPVAVDKPGEKELTIYVYEVE